MKLLVKIYGMYWYLRGWFDGFILSNVYAVKATFVYMEAKEKGSFDETTRAKLIDIARDYQKKDQSGENVYDTIKRFDRTIARFTGIHFTE